MKPKRFPRREHRFDHLVAQVAARAERMVGVARSTVAGADLPDRLPDRVVRLLVGAGPADVVRHREAAQRLRRAATRSTPSGTSSRLTMHGPPEGGR